MNRPVLVLDGEQRSALAVVRSLGRRGIKAYVGEIASSSLASSSRHCSGSFRLPSNLEIPSAYKDAVSQAATQIGAPLILPVTDASLVALTDPEIPGAPATKLRLAAPKIEAYDTLSHKGHLTVLARSLSVPIPRTIVANSTLELHDAIREIGLPAVLKPARSKFHHDGRLVSTSVTVINSHVELGDHMARQWIERVPILVQEFIPGTGAGVFSLYGNLGPVAWFAHRRLREKPPSGGVSVLSESVPVDPEMREYSERLLSAVDWFGPAMIEYRVDPSGRPWLMEVNGRFWGSLQLAIDCGVDFPWLYYKLCEGDVVHETMDYEVGRRLRWLLGDIDHLLLQLRGKGTADSMRSKLGSIRDVLQFLNRSTSFEVLRKEDMGPFWFELRNWFAAMKRQ